MREGLPAVVTIMLSLGVQRMARKNAVIRKLPAVETLGSATYICSDKTGTLTQNLMTVTTLALPDGRDVEIFPIKNDSQLMAASMNVRREQSYRMMHGHARRELGKNPNIRAMSIDVKNKNMDMNTAENKLLMSAMLCNNATFNKDSLAMSGEPTEKALLQVGIISGCHYDNVLMANKRIREIPFDSNNKRMTTVHVQPEGYMSITKGAPDMLLKFCNYAYIDGNTVPMTESLRNKYRRQNERMTNQALRVIAVAQKMMVKNPLLMTNDELEKNLTYLGMLGMIDPPRTEVKDAVNTCKQAGITPVMITGDHVITACVIASELGIIDRKDGKCNTTEAITGEELSKMSQGELTEKIYKYKVFARVSPEHKVRIVKALQSRGEIVAMTGDGVNDAPALKVADIGCSMGKSGTDVAKNASDMILMDDNFATIVSAVKEGRGIYDNIKKSVHFLLSSNIGEIITILIAILLRIPAPLAAVQLLWVNLVTDSLPAIALGVEPPAHDIMNRPPISPKKGLFADGLFARIIFEGIMIGMLALLANLIGGSTMAFAVLSLSQLFHAFNMRSDGSISKVGMFRNKKMIASFVICAFLQIIVISVAPLAVIFNARPLNVSQWVMVVLLSFMPIPIVEFQKKMGEK